MSQLWRNQVIELRYPMICSFTKNISAGELRGGLCINVQYIQNNSNSSTRNSRLLWIFSKILKYT